MKDEMLINKVAQSDLVTIDPEQYYPGNQLAVFDFKDYLFKGLILREKDFRRDMKEFDWSSLEDKYLHVLSSTDAVIPLWAYMLVSVHAQPFAKAILSGDRTSVINSVILQELKEEYPEEKIADGKFVIKGCSKHHLGPELYLDISAYLQPHARSIMFGEPCSTVPIFKKKKI